MLFSVYCLCNDKAITAIYTFLHTLSLSGAVPISVRFSDRCRDGIAGVFAKKDDRQLPDRRHVQAFAERALVRGAVAEEAEADLVGPAGLDAQPGASGERQPAADDRGFADQPLAREIGRAHV